ncbi:3182_t:CDS:2 [Funneliformis caledonium]|uniref:3182_t:CDS:1 n=1 Tax=Funneliformis caledonium TaxID=1117310 RepID=A0A9N8VK86_9GLOM|nr:3182_t:CDS:2 [Funneliformis caledonium]
MSDTTDMSVFVALLMRVARAFFQTAHIVVLDQLTKHEAISDENLAKGVGLNVKEIHKLCGTLKEARLIKTFSKTESKKAEQRAMPRTYYYVDWQQVVNVIKWKIFKIREMVGDRMRSEQENKGYLCPGCKKVFAPLDVHNLFEPLRDAFVCDLCHSELDHNDNAENVKGSEKLHGRFMEQSQPIIDLLKSIDKLRIPVSSVEKFQHGSGAKNGQSGSTRLVIVFQDDNETSKMERQAELEKKRQRSFGKSIDFYFLYRQQNALPAWHVRSTVSGDVMVANAWSQGAAKEIEEQKVENVRVNEKGDEGHNRYLDEYYANLYQDTDTSPMVEEDDEFEEVEVEENEEVFEGDFEEVEIDTYNGHTYAEDDDDFEIVEDSHRYTKRQRTEPHNDDYGKYRGNGNRKSIGTHY